MAENGVKTTNQTLASTVEELLGNNNGSTVRISIDRVAAHIRSLLGPIYATKAELDADLDWAAGAVGTVYADPTPANNGDFLKSGASGTGSWELASSNALSAAVKMALAWAEEDEDVEVETGQYSSKHHALKSSASATAAGISEGNSATSETAANAAAISAQASSINASTKSSQANVSAGIASAAAASAVEVLDENRFITRAAAETAAVGKPDNTFIEILLDEEYAGQRTLNYVDTGALEYVKVLGDLSLNAVTRRYGYAGQMRNTLSVLARIDRDKFGPNGPGNPNQFPNAITASQTSTTITASGANFRRLDAGMMVYWESGEFARILDVVTTSSPVASVLANKSQSVASGAAIVDVKPNVFCFQGDSLGIRLERALRRIFFRAIGFGGLIRMPASGDHFIDKLTVRNGATIENTGDAWGEFPTGSFWKIPAGGEVEYQLFDEYALGTRRSIIPGLSSEQMRTDTYTFVWRRGAGSFRILRRRVYDPEWEVVQTVSDASVGTTSFNYLRAKHDPASPWVYLVVGLTGEIKGAAQAMINEAEPGWVSWDMSRGSYGDSKDLKRFADNFPASDLKELFEIFNPDQHITLTADPADDVDAHLAYIEDATDLWDTATGGRIDHVWLEQWKGTSEVDPDYATAARQFAVSRDHTFIPFLDLFGGYEDDIRPLNLLDDTIHPGTTGMEIMAWQYLRVTGLEHLPVLRVGQDVRAQNVDAVNLSINRRDVKADLDALSQRAPIPSRGAVWSDDDGVLTLDNALSGDLGTSDFTFQIACKMKETATGVVGLLKLDDDNTSAVLQDGGLMIYQEGRFLIVRLADASGNAIDYDFEFFTRAYDEIEGVITIRSDVANGRFDLFWNDVPAIGARGAVTGDTTSPLGTWGGTGTGARVAMGANAANTNHYVKSMAFWTERLSDAEIAENAFSGWWGDTEPEWFWAFDEGAGRAVFDKTGKGRNGLWLAGGATPLNADGPLWLHPRQGSVQPRAVIDRDSGAFKLLPNDCVLFTGVTLPATRSFTLPAEPAVGDTVDFINAVDVTTHNVRIGQPALHQIKSGASATTIGTGGYIQFGGSSDRVVLEVVRAESGVAYEWIVTVQQGGAMSFG